MLGYIEKLLKQIASLVSSAWSTIQNVWKLFSDFEGSIKELAGGATHLITSAVNEYEALTHLTDPKNFNPQWNTRVISVPRAIENIAECISIPNDIVNAIKDLVGTITKKFETFEIGAIAFVPVEFAGWLEQIVTFVGLVADVFAAINQAIKDAQTIVDDITKLRTNLEGLDGLFLPQTSKRTKGDYHYAKRGA